MIHVVCDFCGKDCDKTAMFLTIKSISNWARYHFDSKPFGGVHAEKSFVICSCCAEKHKLPNPYYEYGSVTQDVSYEKNVDNYTDDDIRHDLLIALNNKKADCKLRTKIANNDN